MCIFDSKKTNAKYFLNEMHCVEQTPLFLFLFFKSNGQFMSYKFVSTQINQLVLFSKKLTKTIKKYKSDQIWSILINFDQIWSNLIKSDQKLFLIKIDQIWSDLIRFDQIWSDLYFFIFFEKNIQWFCSKLKPTGLCCCYFSSGICLGWD
jgi:hypothetical protein